jgi:hypothetical protein
MMRHARIFPDTKPACHPPRVFRPAKGASFVLLGGQGAIFDEAAQKIYALNRTAAYIWCRLEELKTAGWICDELVRSGTSESLARQYVHVAVRNWLRLGVLKAEWTPEAAEVQAGSAFALRLTHFTATIRATGESLTQLRAAFRHHVVPAVDGEHVLHVVETDDLIHVFHNQRNVICCEAAELVPALRAYITEQIVTAGKPDTAPDVAFHAACLVRHGKSLLISGAPGVGKTTLAARLTRSGFGYCGDDVVLIAPDGEALGVPLAPAVKSGAWEIVRQFYTDLDQAPVHCRPDGKRVRYLDLPRVVRDEPHPVGWIVFINRTGGPAQLRPLEPADALSRVMEGSFSPGGRTSRETFRSLVRAVASAGVFEMTYADLTDANDMLVRLCDG